MKMTVCSFICAVLAFFACGSNNNRTGAEASATPVETELSQDAVIEWDTMIYDFGDVSVTDGPLTCSFTLTNKSDGDVYIYEVVSSCGCTGVTWTKEGIGPGQSGTITATYKNEDGPMAFDKTLTVYIAGIKRPVILRLRGVVHEKKKSLSELYGAQRLGDLGLKTREFQAPTLRQGHEVSFDTDIANLGKKPLTLDFENVSGQLKVSVSDNPVPAGGKARITFTVKADRSLWGSNHYYATPVVNGKSTGTALDVKAFTQEDFSSLTAEQRENAPLPMFASSTADFGMVAKGAAVKGEFTVENRGKTPLHFFKADPETPALVLSLPGDVAPSAKERISFTLDTSSLPEGECVTMISFVTNSPMRPVVNVFAAGIIR